MAQHFLLSAAARSLSAAKIMRMSDRGVENVFLRLRWAATDGKPVCPGCGCMICYACPRPAGQPRWRCKACRSDFSITSGTLFAWHKLPLRTYLLAIAAFCNEVKGKSMLALSRELDVQYKTAFVLAHKLREAMASSMKALRIGGEGRVAEIDGAYFGGHVRPENRAADRLDRRLAENRSGKRQVVVVMRERAGRTLIQVASTEAAAVPSIRQRVAKGTVLHADESTAWNPLHASFAMQRINHQEAYSRDGACTNAAESYFSRLRRSELGHHHHIAGPYLLRYAQEMAWREDRRRVSNGEQVYGVVGLTMRCRPSVDFCWCGRPPTASMCQNEVVVDLRQRRPSVGQISRIGMDTSKHVFQLHGVNAAEAPVLRKKLRRNEMVAFFEKLAPTVIAIEACGASHHWARLLQSFGHTVKLIAPQLVKPYVKRGKNDAADAEALCEAMSRPTMRFVPVKTAEQQATLMLVGVRDRLIRNRTQLANAIRGHAAEFGLTAAKGVAHLAPLLERVETDESLPVLARELFAMQAKEYAQLQTQIDEVEAKLTSWHKADECSRRLAKIPGVGPIGAMLLRMKTPDPALFQSGRQFAAWIGLTPKDHSTAGKVTLGGITRAGDEGLRSVLVVGATAVIRHALSSGKASPWLLDLLKRKPPKLAAVALANKTARIAWKMMLTGEAYSAKPAAAASVGVA